MRLTPLLIIVSLVISAGLSFIPMSVDATSSEAFLVYKVGSTYYSKNMTTGTVVFSSSDAVAVINSALGSLTPGRTYKEKVLIQCDFDMPDPGGFNIPSYTILELDGTATDTITDGWGSMINALGHDHIELSGGIWVGGATSSDPCIYFTNCIDVYIHDCEITAITSLDTGAMGLLDCTDVLITNNNFHDMSSTNLRIYDASSDVEISYNTFTNSGYGAINIYQSDDSSAQDAHDIWIHNNSVSVTVRAGIGFYPDGPEDSVSNSTIENNTLIDCGTSGMATAISIGGYGWNSGGANGPCYDIIVRNNLIQETGTYNCGGMICAGGNRIDIYANVCENSYTVPLSFTVAFNSSAYDNVIDITRAGPGIQIIGNDNHVYDNKVKGTSSDGMTIDSFIHPFLGSITSSRNIVERNGIISELDHCVSIIDAAESDNQITNNTFFCPTDLDGISDTGTGSIINNNTMFELNGINDQTVFYIQFYWLLNGYSQYEYSNHLFDSVTGDYNGDTTTHLASDNYTHFWWQYFYLLQSMGLNCVRLGAFDDSPSNMLAHAYYDHKDSWDAVWDPMVEMAKLNNISIIFCFAGSNAGGHQRLDNTSAEYLDYTDFYSDVMDEYVDETSIIMWDLYNEPYSNYNQANWWDANGGYSAYMAWRDNVSLNALRHAGGRLIDMGSHPTAWGETAWDNAFADHFDVCDWHGYWSADDTYLISDRSNWSAAFGRPWIMGECAINAPITPPYWWYWDWMNDTAHTWDVSTIWMTLYSLPGYPVLPANFTAIPPVPYPEAPIIPDPPVPPVPPIFSISAISSNKTSTYVNMSVQFSVTITGGIPDIPIIWTFDDGAFSMAEDPTHNWSSAGTYHVSLLVNGTAAPNTLTITVLPISSTAPPTPAPSPSLGDSLSILGYLLPGVVILVVLSLLVGAFRP